jgi:glyoxylase-like metal-dependent hydrolase (beta-lactamase superfamily II)
MRIDKFLFPLCALALSVAAATTASAQTALEVLPVQGNVHLIVGPGGNTTVQTGHEAVIVVDTQTPDVTDALLGAIAELSAKPIRHIILTSASPHHTGGNAALAQAGTYVRLIDSFDPRGLEDNAAIMAHVGVLDRMSVPAGEELTTPPEAWPTDTYFTNEWAVYVNNEGIQMFHVPAAVTDGDTIVFFRRSDVVSTGDIFNADRYPNFDMEQGGSINGVIDGLNLVLELTIAGENQNGGTVVVPGHGRLSDETDVVNYRDMATIIRDRIQAMIDDGKTLDEVLAAKPSSDYDDLYRNNKDSWTGDTLVEAIYRDLTRGEQ